MSPCGTPDVETIRWRNTCADELGAAPNKTHAASTRTRIRPERTSVTPLRPRPSARAAPADCGLRARPAFALVDLERSEDAEFHRTFLAPRFPPEKGGYPGHSAPTKRPEVRWSPGRRAPAPDRHSRSRQPSPR